MKKFGLAALAAMLVLAMVVPAVWADDIVFCYDSEDGPVTVVVDEAIAPLLPGHSGACEVSSPAVPSDPDAGVGTTTTTVVKSPRRSPGPLPAPSTTVGVWGCGLTVGAILIVDVNWGIVAVLLINADGCVDGRVQTAALPFAGTWARLYLLPVGSNVAQRLVVANAVACQIHEDNDECIWLVKDVPADFVISGFGNAADTYTITSATRRQWNLP